jgi:hypothetical protein
MVGYERLASAERVWVNARSFIDSVNNGGCISYFYNSGADHLDDCREALRTLGATAELTELERVCALFGTTVPADIEERNDIIAGWDDDAHETQTLEDADQALMPMMDGLEARLAKFVKNHFPAT